MFDNYAVISNITMLKQFRPQDNYILRMWNTSYNFAETEAIMNVVWYEGLALLERTIKDHKVLKFEHSKIVPSIPRAQPKSIKTNLI